MSARPIDPTKLDVAVFAAAGGEASGQWPLAGLSRLAGSVLAEETPEASVHWQAEGDHRPVTGGEPEIWLHLTAQACVSMRCQRCLSPMAVGLDIDRWIRFVRGSAAAEALDAELEEDVLELPRHLNLRELVEDELLLELPIVPRHDVCPQPLPLGTSADPEAAGESGGESRPNPFAALAQLKQKKPGG